MYIYFACFLSFLSDLALSMFQMSKCNLSRLAYTSYVRVALDFVLERRDQD